MAATLAVLIAGGAQAQQAATPDLAPPRAGAPAPGADIANQSRQHLVPQHFTRDGQFVPQHYEAAKPAPFRGYFADRQADRQRQKQHGYKEPAPDYTTPQPDTGQRAEGR